MSDRQNCGNLLAGVGPFAVERRLLRGLADGPVDVRIHMLNTNSIATATFEVANGQPVYAGRAAVSGVPGTAAPIRLDFEGIAGSTCGALLPTGNSVDVVGGVECTLVDNGMPVVVLRADSLGVTGYESCRDLEANSSLRERLEQIRLQAGELMGLGDVSGTTVPKMTLVSPPQNQGSICTRTFIPHRCHDAIGVLGAVSVATAALIPGTPASSVMGTDPAGSTGSVVLEHPTGTFEASVDVEMVDAAPQVGRAGIVRTARKLMDGVAFERDYP